MLEHQLLLHKMERYGLCGTVLDWFRSYLSNRKIRVKCKPTSTGQTEVSEEYSIEYGTPQFSCLGPLIFLIFCNDLRLNLKIVQDWFNANKLTLNLTKTTYMTFHTKTSTKTDRNLTLNGVTLPKTQCTKIPWD